MMSSMRFDSIELHNYRYYTDFILRFTDNGLYDLHVMTAKNGVGKTTLLNAITWCLYEDEPHVLKDADGMPILNSTVGKRAAENGDKSIDGYVIIRASNEDKRFVFKRSAEGRVDENGFITGITSKLTVTETSISSGKSSEVYEGSAADACIRKYLPSAIRDYFFFDGEQLENYFSESTAEKVKNSIHAISQVDLLTDVKQKYASLIRKKQAEVGKRAPNLDAIRVEIEAHEQLAASYREEMEACKEAISANQKRIEELNEKLRGYEHIPELNAERDKLQEEYEAAQIELSDLNRELMRYIRDTRMKFSFYDAATRTLEYIDEKRKAGKFPASVSSQDLLASLSDGKCFVCDQELSHEAREKIQGMLEEMDLSNEVTVTLSGIENDLKTLVEEVSQYPAQRDKYIASTRKQKNKVAEIKSKFEKVTGEIKEVGGSEMIERYMKEKDELTQDNIDKNHAMALAKIGLESEEKELIKLRKKFDKAADKEKTAKGLNQDIKVLEKAREIVEGVEHAMMQDVRSTMEKSTTAHFLAAVWKKNTYTSVIVAEDYQVNVIHRDGYKCLGTISSGERALLVMAYTLAIHSVSGFDAPLIIDTPLSRISDENRRNFASVLKEISKEKEIILLFTPDEFSKEVHEVYDGVLATNAVLDLNADETTNVLKEGD